MLSVEVDAVPLGAGGADQTFQAEFEINCDVGEVDDGDTRIVTNPATDVDFSAFFTALAANAATTWAGANYTATVTELGAPIWWDVTFSDNDGVADTDCSFGPSSLATLTAQLSGGYVCTITNTVNVDGLPFLQVNKDFDGDQATEFTYLVETEPADGSCLVIIGTDVTVVADGETFTIAADETADVYCAAATVTEQPGEGFTYVSLICDDGLPNVDADSVAGSVFFRLGSEGDASPCTWTNTVDETDDDPALPNVSATKVCFGGEGDATFSVTVGDVTDDSVACGDTVTAVDVEPGDVTVSEEEAEGFTTFIACGDDAIAETNSVTVTIPAEGATDVSCIILNDFEGDGADLDDLICSCTCCGGEIDIDLNNSNTNTIGIDNANTNNNANDNDNANLNENDNENKNDNQNENTQNQENTQDQNNTNDQTNNITSSPEVNIDFD
jgi:hypothetical protein